MAISEEDKQNIISAVLSAIRTNSKTIEQLTPVTSLSDDDDIELSGGKRVHVKVLRELLGGSGLTPWQKAFLENLEAEQNKSKFSVEMTLSISEKKFNGEDTQVTVYVTPKYNGSVVEATVTGTSSNLNGKTFTRGGDGRYFAIVTVAAPASVNTSLLTEMFTANVTYAHATAGTMTKSVSATFHQNVMSMIIEHPKDYDDMLKNIVLAINGAWAKKPNLAGHYSINVNGSNYVYFMVPNNGNTISSVKSSGFEVPLATPRTDVEVMFGGKTVHYWLCRTAGIPRTSPFVIDIS